jgi:hypothetical protein
MSPLVVLGIKGSATARVSRDQSELERARRIFNFSRPSARPPAPNLVGQFALTATSFNDELSRHLIATRGDGGSDIQSCWSQGHSVSPQLSNAAGHM